MRHYKFTTPLRFYSSVKCDRELVGDRWQTGTERTFHVFMLWALNEAAGISRCQPHKVTRPHASRWVAKRPAAVSLLANLRHWQTAVGESKVDREREREREGWRDDSQTPAECGHFWCGAFYVLRWILAALFRGCHSLNDLPTRTHSTAPPRTHTYIQGAATPRKVQLFSRRQGCWPSGLQLKQWQVPLKCVWLWFQFLPRLSPSVRLCTLSQLLSGSTLIIRLVDRAISVAF